MRECSAYLRPNETFRSRLTVGYSNEVKRWKIKKGSKQNAQVDTEKKEELKCGTCHTVGSQLKI